MLLCLFNFFSHFHDKVYNLFFEGAVAKMVQALDEFRVRGVKTNLPFLARVMDHPDFKAGTGRPYLLAHTLISVIHGPILIFLKSNIR